VLGACFQISTRLHIFWEPVTNAKLHHTFGHNVFLWALFVGWVTWQCRSWLASVLSFLSFGSHLLADAQLSGWSCISGGLFSHEAIYFPAQSDWMRPSITAGLLSPITVILLAAIVGRTPLDIVSPNWINFFLAWFRRKDSMCGTCHRPCNQMCDRCKKPVCIRHATLRRGLSIVCPKCASDNLLSVGLDCSGDFPTATLSRRDSSRGKRPAKRESAAPD